MEPDVEDPTAKQNAIAEHQRAVAAGTATLDQSAKGPSFVKPSVVPAAAQAVQVAA
jgi:hypothetical protein